ncbi:hypothetical protein [Stenotrophomonas rhizophila]
MKLLHNLTLVAALLVSACTSELATAGPAPTPPETQVVRYRLVAVPLVEPPHPPKREPPPLRLVAPNSSRAHIVDKGGNEIRRAPKGRSIAEMKVSPKRQWVLLYFGDADYTVASVDRLKDIAKPPIQPAAAADATGFRWLPLDDDRLIGYAQLPSLKPTRGLTASEADSLPPRGTLVYIYTIATDAMSPVEIDESVPQPFSISDDSYGNLAIEPHSGLAAFGLKILQIP